MTLAVRNSVFTLGILLSIALLVSFAAVGIALLAGPYQGVALRISDTQGWMGMTWNLPEASVRAALWGQLGVAGLATAGAIASATLFRRVNSPEIYFVTLFLLTIPLELGRIVQPLLAVWNVSPMYGTTLTRIIVFVRLLGALSLFSAGVYAAGADYARIGSMTVLLSSLAFLIVYLVPVDTGTLYANQLHSMGSGSGVDLLILFLSIGTVVNYAISWINGYSDRGGLGLSGIAAVVVGRDLLYYLPSMAALVAATILIALGTTALIVIHRAHHLWS